MKVFKLSKDTVKNFLANRIATNILNTPKDELVEIIRFGGMDGLENFTDEDLFDYLVASIPEFRVFRILRHDEHYLVLEIGKEHVNDTDNILTDIKRLIQLHFNN